MARTGVPGPRGISAFLVDKVCDVEGSHAYPSHRNCWSGLPQCLFGSIVHVCCDVMCQGQVAAGYVVVS